MPMMNNQANFLLKIVFKDTKINLRVSSIRNDNELQIQEESIGNILTTTNGQSGSLVSLLFFIV